MPDILNELLILVGVVTLFILTALAAHYLLSFLCYLWGRYCTEKVEEEEEVEMEVFDLSPAEQEPDQPEDPEPEEQGGGDLAVQLPLAQLNVRRLEPSCSSNPNVGVNRRFRDVLIQNALRSSSRVSLYDGPSNPTENINSPRPCKKTQSCTVVPVPLSPVQEDIEPGVGSCTTLSSWVIDVNGSSEEETAKQTEDQAAKADEDD